MASMGNHLWQSTLCVLAVWILTLALRNNRAAIRYGLWLAASLKFLLPFSLLVALGNHVSWRSGPAPQFDALLTGIERSLALPMDGAPLPAAPAPASHWPAILVTVWIAGMLLVLMDWVRLVKQVRALRRGAIPLDLRLPIPALSSPSRVEPGVFGVRQPVLILPAGILERLTPPQLEAVIAHELCHVRRKDNLTAALHMLVEMIFWFHPLVWYIRTRLVAERERACDEEVVRNSAKPNVYAEAILNVCRFYVESPAVCMPGITGANLKMRIAEILGGRIVRNLSSAKKGLLAAIGIAALLLPVGLGMLHAPPLQARSQDAPAFEVASIKPTPPPPEGGVSPPRFHETPGGIDYSSVSVQSLILKAYSLKNYQLSLPREFAAAAAERWDIVAHAPPDTSKEQLPLMLRSLLVERFQLAFHRESKELAVYAMVAGKGGLTLQEVEAPEGPLGGSRSPSGGVRLKGRVSLDLLAYSVELTMGRPVINATGRSGIFDISLDYARDEPAPAGIDGRAVGASLPGQNLQKAMEETLGLKLEPRKASFDILIVDRIGKPAAN